jgi:DnaK suppressor protein
LAEPYREDEAEYAARQFADVTEQRLADVEHALSRLDSGSYEQCEVCGQPIGVARLEERPSRRFCVAHDSA